MLEHLSITEQLDLFDDASAEFKLAQTLYLVPKPARASGTLPTLQSAQTSSCSKKVSEYIEILSEPDLYKVKINFEERIKNALQYNLAFESPLFYVRNFFNQAFSNA